MIKTILEWLMVILFVAVCAAWLTVVVLVFADNESEPDYHQQCIDKGGIWNDVVNSTKDFCTLPKGK